MMLRRLRQWAGTPLGVARLVIAAAVALSGGVIYGFDLRGWRVALVGVGMGVGGGYAARYAEWLREGQLAERAAAENDEAQMRRWLDTL